MIEAEPSQETQPVHTATESLPLTQDLAALPFDERMAATVAWEHAATRNRAVTSLIYANEIGLIVLMDSASCETVVDACPSWTAEHGDEWSRFWPGVPMTRAAAIKVAQRIVAGNAPAAVLAEWRRCYDIDRASWEKSVADYCEELRAERIAESRGWL